MEKTMTEEKYVMTEWGCLSCTLEEYGIDVSHITGRVGAHIVEDFMDAMCNAGYVSKREAKDGDVDWGGS